MVSYLPYEVEYLPRSTNYIVQQGRVHHWDTVAHNLLILGLLPNFHYSCHLKIL